jgi:hypothetical protein
MVGDRQVWQSDRGGLFIDNAVVSFQRYPCPSDKIVGDAPSSYGALPVAPEGDHHLLPLPDQEAFGWASSFRRIGIAVRCPS